MYDSIDFAERGASLTLHPYIIFLNPLAIHLKSNIVISEFCWIHGGLKTIIGNFIHISSFSSIVGGGVCIFEDFVGLSAGARIITGSEMVKGEGLTNPTIPAKFRAVRRSFVHLEKHVFLGSDVVIHPSVTIGEGAVIASNSVVLSDIEPWTINAGIPSKVKGRRKKETIKRLEECVYRECGVQPFDPVPYLNLKTVQERVPTDL